MFGCFSLEPRQAIGIPRQRIGEDLDRDVAIQPRVPRTVHLAHPACTKHTDDFVLSKPEPGGERH
jgi:hypothetical protein